MPKALEDKLRKTAAKKGYTGERADHYVYGSMTNIKKRKKMGPGEMQRHAIAGAGRK